MDSLIEAIRPIIIYLAVAVAVQTLIAAVLLRKACKICKVDDPPFLNAWGICALATLVNFGASFAIGLVVGASAGHWGIPQEDQVLVAQLLSLGVGVVLTTVIYSVTIALSLARALLVCLVQILLGILLAISIGILVFIIYLIFMASCRAI